MLQEMDSLMNNSSHSTVKVKFHLLSETKFLFLSNVNLLIKIKNMSF